MVVRLLYKDKQFELLPKLFLQCSKSYELFLGKKKKDIH